MDKFCGECGSPLNENGCCPNCDVQNQVPEENNVHQEVHAVSSTVASEGTVDENKKAAGKKKLLIAKIIISVICALLVVFSVCVALVYYDVLDIPPVNAILEKLDMIEEEPEEQKSSEKKTENQTDDSAGSKTNSKKDYLINFKCDTFDIYVDDEEYVTFTVEVTDPDAVNTDKLGLYDENGKIVEYLHDDGEDGDRTEGDNIYSAKTELYSAEIKMVKYYASDKKFKSNEFSINFYENIDRESFEAMETLSKSLEGLSYEEALNVIKNSSEVESYTADDETRIITYKTIYGFTGMHEDPNSLGSDFKASGANSLPKDDEITYEDYLDAERIVDKMDLTNMNGLDPDVIVLRPFRESQFTYDDFKYAGELVADATDGYVTVVDENDADISRFKSLSNYGSVLIDSHGAWVKNTSYIVTGEEFSLFRNYSADYHSDRIVILSGGRLAINGEFFNRYYSDNSLDSSFWFLGTCYSLKNESIANALISKGAGAVTGFTDPVTVGYCNKTLFESVINSMVISTDSVKNGVESAKDFYGETDGSNPDCEYVFEGNSSYILFNSNVNKTSSERDIILVLDRSGSMSGTPLTETKTAATKFVENILGEKASIGIVTYESGADIISYTTDNDYALINSINGIATTGGTNAEAGLKLASDMLSDSKADKKIIVMMSDGVPNEGVVGDELIEYANEIKDDGIYIYTLGFFEALADKYEAQRVMRGIASEGCHYEVSDASELVFFFEDMAAQINGQRYYHIRIACPVDVTVKYNGETLSSAEDDLNTRTSFGTITFEQAEAEEETSSSYGDSAYGDSAFSNDSSLYGETSLYEDTSDEDDEEKESDNLVKILRLKEGVSYDISIEGTGNGKMDYTISFMNEDGEYTDQRKFRNIKITKRTEIDTVAARLSKTTLNVDEDGDGEYDIIYRAGKNGKGEIVDNSAKLNAIFITGAVAALILALIITLSIFERKKSRKQNTAI